MLPPRIFMFSDCTNYLSVCTRHSINSNIRCEIAVSLPVGRVLLPNLPQPVCPVRMISSHQTRRASRDRWTQFLRRSVCFRFMSIAHRFYVLQPTQRHSDRHGFWFQVNPTPASVHCPGTTLWAKSRPLLSNV